MSTAIGINEKKKIGFFLISSLVILGISTAFYITVVGQLYVSEIILLIIFPFLLLQKRPILKNKWVKLIIIFGYLWLFSQVITDLIRTTPADDTARGLASIIVFIIAFLSLFLIISGEFDRIKIYLLGVCVGGFFRQFLQPSLYFSSEPWKFGYGPVITLLVLLIIISVKPKGFIKSVFPIIILFCLGGISFYLNARSIGAFVMMTAFVMLIDRSKFFGNSLNNGHNSGSIVIICLLLVGFSFGLINIYGRIAENGWLGVSAKQKYEQQSSGSLGLLLGGRVEILSSIQAVLDSPIIGHGSWATDKKYLMYLYDLRELGYDISRDQIEYRLAQSDLIPTHSHLFQNWVWAGVLGASFWVMILVLVLKSFILNLRYPNSLYIIVMYFTFASIWDIFFSPFGSFMRMEWVLRLIIFITSISLFSFEKK